jgi:hypothetical protein
MAKDFTLVKYKEFLQAGIEAGYRLTSFQDYLKDNSGRVMILRHDVDRKPINSLRTAELQYSLGVKGTYYFRATKESFNVEIIKQIRDLGHEIGYHYEDLAIHKGDSKKAIVHFIKWLDKLKEIYPVKTICMHGSPLSKWDNRELWKSYDYKDYGIIAEPYFDLNFDQVFYITDTGRRWDGDKVSVRDKVNSTFDLSFHSTNDIINAFQKKQLPNHIMQNIHPQRWTDTNGQWIKEMMLQKLKNGIKKSVFVKK